jgi:mutator protein MutT
MNSLFKNFFKIIPSDHFARKYPISVKGILLVNNKIVLLKNERNEWELPGGKIEPGETPEQCVLREIKEELGIVAMIDYLHDAWMYKVGGKVNVFIVVYLCKPQFIDEKKIKSSWEHTEFGLFSQEETATLKMPEGYNDSIKKSIPPHPETSSV